MNTCDYCGKQLNGLMENVNHHYECSARKPVANIDEQQRKGNPPFVVGAEAHKLISEALRDIYKTYIK